MSDLPEKSNHKLNELWIIQLSIMWGPWTLRLCTLMYDIMNIYLVWGYHECIEEHITSFSFLFLYSFGTFLFPVCLNNRIYEVTLGMIPCLGLVIISLLSPLSWNTNSRTIFVSGRIMSSGSKLVILIFEDAIDCG